MKNRLLSAILALCLICALLSGCGQSYTVTLNENYPDGNTTEISTSSAKAIAEETPVRQFRTANLIKYVSVIVSSAPVMLLYPFVQKYFAQGVMIGSLKG